MAMRRLAEDHRTLFLGQSVAYGGSTMYGTLDGVPEDKRLEMPVVEDFQMGFSLGLAMDGKLPICIYPRIDFMLIALNQLVNHLDKAQALWGIEPHIIIRTRVGGKRPLDAGPQHTNNHTNAFRSMLTTVHVREINYAHQVEMAYKHALEVEGAWMIVENPL